MPKKPRSPGLQECLRQIERLQAENKQLKDQIYQADEVKSRPPNDQVNSPRHYTYGRFETIDVIEDMIGHYDPIAGNLVSGVLRYLSRAPHKGNYQQDLEKAQWYMNRLVSRHK